MKKLCILAISLLSLTSINTYAITATPLSPVDFIKTIPNKKPILLPQDPAHFLIYTIGEITLIDAVKQKIAGTIPKPNPNENLKLVFALQSGNLLALDTTGLYRTEDLGRHWTKISEDIFGSGSFTFKFLQSKLEPQNLFVLTDDEIFLSHDEGQTWQVLWKEKFFSTNVHPFDVVQTTDANIYILTHHGKVQVTKDEGLNWQVITALPKEPDYWMEKAFCALNANIAYAKFDTQIFAIKSPQEVNLVYTDKGYGTDCFVDQQQNLYVSSMNKEGTKTDIISVGTNFSNSFPGRIYNITQDSAGKYYLNTKLGLASALTLNNPIDLYPAIFKQGVIQQLSIANEKDFVVAAGYDWEGPFDTYLSQDGGSQYTHLDKKYYHMFYFNEALTYLVRCDSQLCFKTSQDNGKTWKLIELPKEIIDIYDIDQDRGRLIIHADNGVFLSADLEHWDAVLVQSVKGRTIPKKRKALFIPRLKEMQFSIPQKIKSLRTVNPPHSTCPFFSLELNISPSNVFTLLQHSCRADDDIYLSKDEGAHWTRAHSNLPASILDSPYIVPLFFLDNGDLIIEDYNGDTLQKSTDGGVHFSNLIKNIPPIDLGGADTFAHAGNDLFAIGTANFDGTRSKIYLSRDAGNTWERVDIINSITMGLHFANNHLLIATNGDGIFSANLPLK